MFSVFEINSEQEIKPILHRNAITTSRDGGCNSMCLYESELVGSTDDIVNDKYHSFSTNALTGKLWLTCQQNNRHSYIGSAIVHIGVMKHEITSNITMTFIAKDFYGSGDTNTGDLKVKKTYKLFMSRNEPYSLYCNGDICSSIASIERFFGLIKPIISEVKGSENKYHHVLASTFRENFFDKPTEVNLSTLTAYYRVKRNIRLKDLPWDSQQLTALYKSATATTNNRRGRLSGYMDRRCLINRYLSLGNTKKAVDACFYGFTFARSVRRLLIKMGPRAYNQGFYIAVSDALKHNDINNVLSLLSWYAESYNADNIDTCSVDCMNGLAALTLGFSVRQIKRTEARIISDTVKMHDMLSKENIQVVFINHIQEYHRALSIALIHHNVSTLNPMMVLYMSIPTSGEDHPYSVGKYVVRRPITASELDYIALDTDTCVGSYMELFFKGLIDIFVIVNEDGEYVAILEVMQRHIVQAKLTHNRKVIDDAEVYDVVSEWAQAMHFKQSCNDLGANNKRVGFNTPIRERLELIASHPLVGKKSFL